MTSKKDMYTENFNVGVLIPAYNEQNAIADVVSQVKRYCNTVVVVDDGSKDNTAVNARNTGVSVVVHAHNKGKGEAIKTGFFELKRKKCDAVIIMDGDAQHDPSEIPEFIQAALSHNADVVIGNRMHDPVGMPLIRKLTNKFTSYVISKTAGVTIADTQCGYRLIKTWVIDTMTLRTSLYDTESEMILQAARAGAVFVNVPIKSIYSGTESNIHKIRDTIRFFSLVFRYMLQTKNNVVRLR